MKTDLGVKIIQNILSMSWVGQGDFGDEVMAVVMRKYLQNLGVQKITYYHLGKYPKYVEENDLQINSLYDFNTSGFKKRLLDYWNLRKFNIAISGGGSILHSFNSINWRYSAIKLMQKLNFNFKFAACLGISVGPFSNQDQEKMCGKFLDMNELVITRDNYSGTLAKKLSHNENIHSSLDISLLLPNLCASQWQAAISGQRDGNLVGMMFIQKKGEEKMFEEKQFLQKFLVTINHLIDKGKTISLFNLYIGDLYPDSALNEKIKLACKNPEKVRIHSFDGDIFKTINEINRCGYVASMRLHGIIFSYLLGIPFISMSYNRKNDDFCESIDYPKEYAFDFYANPEIEPILNSMDKLLKQGENAYSSSMPLALAQAKVEKDFELLKDLITKI